jgi:L-rhamnose mutarotase
MKRYGQVIGLQPDKIDEYKRLHAAVWPDVLKMIGECNIRNYSIFLKEPENLMFAYFEYHGTDFDSDMAKMAADPTTQKWWSVCMPCQKPLETRKDGEWWAGMEEVFHTD